MTLQYQMSPDYLESKLKSHFTQGLNRGDTDNLIWDCTGIFALVPWLLSSQQSSSVSGQVLMGCQGTTAPDLLRGLTEPSRFPSSISHKNGVVKDAVTKV